MSVYRSSKALESCNKKAYKFRFTAQISSLVSAFFAFQIIWNFVNSLKYDYIDRTYPAFITPI